jgi:predicted amidohydrolase
VVGERTPAGRDAFLAYHASAIDIPSPAIERIETIARETGVFIVSGVIERDHGTLYCTCVFVGPEGYVSKHRKLVPTGTERLVWGQGMSFVGARCRCSTCSRPSGDGSTLPVLERTFKDLDQDGKQHDVQTKLSAAICW